MGHMEAGPIALDDLKPGDELQQSALWGRFKQRLGWCPEPVYWVAGGSGGTLLSLRHVTPLGPLVYVPGAPATPPARGDAGRVLADLAPEITLQSWTFANDRAPVRPTVVRYDLPWSAGERCAWHARAAASPMTCTAFRRPRIRAIGGPGCIGSRRASAAKWYTAGGAGIAR